MLKNSGLTILVIGAFSTSCTTANENFESIKTNDTPKHVDYSDMVTHGDTTRIGDTGGQTGNNPIKP